MRTDMTILIVVFYNFAYVPKNVPKSGTEHKHFLRQAKVAWNFPDALLKLSPLLGKQFQFRAIAIRLMSILNSRRQRIRQRKTSIKKKLNIIPYPTAFPYGNGMVLHFYQQQESSTTKTVHKVINKRLKAYV